MRVNSDKTFYFVYKKSSRKSFPYLTDGACTVEQVSMSKWDNSIMITYFSQKTCVSKNIRLTMPRTA